MLRKAAFLFLRHSFNPNINISHYPFVYHLSTPINTNTRTSSFTFPDYSATFFGFCRKFCISTVSDKELAIKGVDNVHEIITENSGFGMNLEEALDKAEIAVTSDLVVGILDRLRFEHRLAFRFFMWAQRHETYRHEFKVYNEMIDMLSSSPLSLKQFRIVCHVLDYMKRTDKKSVPSEVLLGILKKYSDKYLMEKKWGFRSRKAPVIAAFNLLIDALCECGLVDDAHVLFRRMRSRVKPDENTFSILFFGCCEARNMKRGMKILEEMTSVGFKPNSFTYNTAIDSLWKAEMGSKAVELFEFMKSGRSAECPPTARTYALMVLGLVKSDRFYECFRVVDDMMKSGCLIDVQSYKKLIEEMCLAGKIEEAYKFTEEMTKKGYPPDIVTYNCFLKALCDNKKAGEARLLYDKMVEMRCIPSVHTYNMLLEMFFAMDDLDGVVYTWEEMNQRRCNRDANTYCVMIEGLFDNNKGEDACLLLNEVVNKRVRLPYEKFEVFLMHLSKMGDLRGIQCLSDHMKTFYSHGMNRRISSIQNRESHRRC